MIAKTWILVADAAKARLLEITKSGASLRELMCFAYPDSRTPGQSPAHGPLPRAKETIGSARHVIEPRTPLQVKHQQQFAELLSKALDRAHGDRRFDHLVLVVPPRFLGVLRKHLGEQTMKCVVATVTQDLVSLPMDELRNYIPKPLLRSAARVETSRPSAP